MAAAVNGDHRPVLLVLRALKLGDLLTAVPALRALAEAFPNHRRVLAAPWWLAPLVHHLGVVDEVCHSTEDLDPLPADVHGVEIAVDLHGRGPGSQPVLLATRPGRLVAFAHPGIPETAGGPQWRAGEHEVVRWCRLLSESGIPADPRRLDVAPPSVPPPAVAPGATLIHPGAASGARRWPADRWAAVAEAERRAGRAVVVTGSASERDLAERVAGRAGLGPERVLAGRTDLLGLLATVAAAGRVVCGDTGVAHVATALRVPSVVLFGPVPPSEWGPPTDRPWHRALWAGRRGDPHAAEPDPGLLLLQPPDVIRALDALPGPYRPLQVSAAAR